MVASEAHAARETHDVTVTIGAAAVVFVPRRWLVELRRHLVTLVVARTD